MGVVPAWFGHRVMLRTVQHRHEGSRCFVKSSSGSVLSPTPARIGSRRSLKRALTAWTNSGTSNGAASRGEPGPVSAPAQTAGVLLLMPYLFLRASAPIIRPDGH